jgi:hypothetical protein
VLDIESSDPTESTTATAEDDRHAPTEYSWYW